MERRKNKTLCITIVRLAQYGEALHGRLMIAGERVCDTLERASACLSEGVHTEVGAEKILVCSNGPHALRQGQVAVGEWRYMGFLVHSEEAFAPLVHRLKMSRRRGHEITIEVIRSF